MINQTKSFVLLKLKGADVNSDGKVSFEEFLKMLQSIH